MNTYQKRIAKRVLAVLLSAQAETNISRTELRKLVSLLSMEQWRTISFVAGVPVAQMDAKQGVLEMLKERSIRRIA